jgi:hypothetical protein
MLGVLYKTAFRKSTKNFIVNLIRPTHRVQCFKVIKWVLVNFGIAGMEHLKSIIDEIEDEGIDETRGKVRDLSSQGQRRKRKTLKRKGGKNETRNQL